MIARDLKVFMIMIDRTAMSSNLRLHRNERKRHPPFAIVVSNIPLPYHRPDCIHWVALIPENLSPG